MVILKSIVMGIPHRKNSPNAAFKKINEDISSVSKWISMVDFRVSNHGSRELWMDWPHLGCVATVVSRGFLCQFSGLQTHKNSHFPILLLLYPKAPIANSHYILNTCPLNNPLGLNEFNIFSQAPNAECIQAGAEHTIRLTKQNTSQMGFEKQWFW
jgi:hypothetical protein